MKIFYVSLCLLCSLTTFQPATPAPSALPKISEPPVTTPHRRVPIETRFEILYTRFIGVEISIMELVLEVCFRNKAGPCYDIPPTAHSIAFKNVYFPAQQEVFETEETIKKFLKTGDPIDEKLALSRVRSVIPQVKAMSQRPEIRTCTPKNEDAAILKSLKKLEQALEAYPH